MYKVNYISYLETKLVDTGEYEELRIVKDVIKS
jgi:hypothetical protein